MCIRDRLRSLQVQDDHQRRETKASRGAPEDGRLEKVGAISCLLYTSDAADERSSVDLGGRRIIKQKKQEKK